MYRRRFTHRMWTTAWRHLHYQYYWFGLFAHKRRFLRMNSLATLTGDIKRLSFWHHFKKTRPLSSSGWTVSPTHCSIVTSALFILFVTPSLSRAPGVRGCGMNQSPVQADLGPSQTGPFTFLVSISTSPFRGKQHTHERNKDCTCIVNVTINFIRFQPNQVCFEWFPMVSLNLSCLNWFLLVGEL